MALNPQGYARTVGRAASAEIDAGLRSYMLRVYNTMALGVALTGIVALAVAANPAFMQAVALGPMKWVLFIALLGLGWFGPKVIMTGSTGAAHAVYWVYAAVWGALLSPIVIAYAGADIARAFFITAAAFAGTSLYGYTTKRDLSAMGRFLVMASIGLLIAVLVNAFLIESTSLDFFLSVAIVLVFAGMTAWETQSIKEMYLSHAGDADTVSRMAIFGAMMLYGSFITMFIWILNIVGMSRE
ncbi:MAG: Bax inhibitor-1 family protein [Alphaproteobacteria bacterium]